MKLRELRKLHQDSAIGIVCDGDYHLNGGERITYPCGCSSYHKKDSRGH